MDMRKTERLPARLAAMIAVVMAAVILAVPAAAAGEGAHVHDMGEWTTVTAAGEFSAGERTAACRLCGKEKKESFYPDGTLTAGGENDPEAVKALQRALIRKGYSEGRVDGKYDSATEAAVKRAQKDLGMKADGIAWPGLLKALELPVSRKKELAVAKTVTKGPENGVFFTAGETAALRTEIRNRTGSRAEEVRVTDSLTGSVWTPGTMEEGEIRVFDELYTVTEEDAEAGMLLGLAEASGSGDTGTGALMWQAPAGIPGGDVYVYTECVSVPEAGVRFGAGEEAEFRITVTNPGKQEIYDVRLELLLQEGEEPCRRNAAVYAGASAVYYFRTAVTEAQAGQGLMVNEALVRYRTAEGEEKEQKSNACTVLCGQAGE